MSSALELAEKTQLHLPDSTVEKSKPYANQKNYNRATAAGHEGMRQNPQNRGGGAPDLMEGREPALRLPGFPRPGP
ncbi:hypothetical protein DSCOOX_37220 [Desulfosarcina ovata subsp. ovata]|uniref:Uncharacterized protein n=1 Tax=Desulfosarcina ovata subsp. ovata TaxID=2752305 RepID=A0A5K8AD01_9BACT|nr:hypothetical protein DSCOOX_37220 [Desulfosarcina ovata subsp. ovata]